MLWQIQKYDAFVLIALLENRTQLIGELTHHVILHGLQLLFRDGLILKQAQFPVHLSYSCTSTIGINVCSNKEMAAGFDDNCSQSILS